MSYKNSKARFSDLKNNLFNVQVEDYGLSTREDIESKFNEFCQEKQNKYHISEIFPSSEKHKTLLLEQSYKQGSNENMLMNRTSSAAGIGKDNADSTKNLWTDSNESIIK